jgi:hypothetical protein
MSDPHNVKQPVGQRPPINKRIIANQDIVIFHFTSKRIGEVAAAQELLARFLKT